MFLKEVVILNRKIKIGICQWSMPIEGPYACKIANDFGLDGIQLDLGTYKNGFPLSYDLIRKAYLEMKEKFKIDYPSIAINETDHYSLNDSQNKKDEKIVMMAINKSIEAAENMNIPLVLIPSFEKSEIKNIGELNCTAKVLKYACDYAGSKGIIIGTENTLSVEENLILFKKVDRPNLKLYFDTQNPFYNKKYIVVEMLEKLMPYICEIHIKDGKDHLSGSLLGEGNTDFKNSIKFIKESNYSGWIILENYYDKYPLRLKNDNPFELLKEDISILKSCLFE